MRIIFVQLVDTSWISSHGMMIHRHLMSFALVVEYNLVMTTMQTVRLKKENWYILNGEKSGSKMV